MYRELKDPVTIRTGLYPVSPYSRNQVVNTISRFVKFMTNTPNMVSVEKEASGEVTITFEAGCEIDPYAVTTEGFRKVMKRIIAGNYDESYAYNFEECTACSFSPNCIYVPHAVVYCILKFLSDPDHAQDEYTELITRIELGQVKVSKTVVKKMQGVIERIVSSKPDPVNAEFRLAKKKEIAKLRAERRKAIADLEDRFETEMHNKRERVIAQYQVEIDSIRSQIENLKEAQKHIWEQCDSKIAETVGKIRETLYAERVKTTQEYDEKIKALTSLKA